MNGMVLLEVQNKLPTQEIDPHQHIRSYTYIMYGIALLVFSHYKKKQPTIFFKDELEHQPIHIKKKALPPEADGSTTQPSTTKTRPKAFRPWRARPQSYDPNEVTKLSVWSHRVSGGTSTMQTPWVNGTDRPQKVG